jgi:GNAT superfamily N-acetyltransferase
MAAIDRSGFEVRVLQGADIEAAATLFATDYRRLRNAVPGLPEALLDPAATTPLLRRSIDRAPGMAAFREGHLIGYLVGLPMPGLRGSGTAAYVPEWGHACSGADRAAVWETLYAALSGCWLERGWLVQCVSILAGDAELESRLVWLGFGLCVVDAVGGLGPEARPGNPQTGVEVRRAGADDLDALTVLAGGEEAHYSAAPTFLHRDADETPRHRMASALAAADEAVWIASGGTDVLSYLHVRPPRGDVCRIVQEPATLSIGGAFTVPEARGRGIAGALVAVVESWAREAGYSRLAVDFESANLSARRFWLSQFEPVCLSFERHLDDRLAPPHAGDRP